MERISTDDVTVKSTRTGVEIFVDDKRTDTLIVFRASRGGIGINESCVVAHATLRGNFSRWARSFQQATLRIDAPEVSTSELNHRRVKAGLEPLVEYDQVAVAFLDFDTPSAAAAHTGRTFTYEADKALRLTVGDRVLVPVGDQSYDLDNRRATVVALNAECPVDYIKRVICRIDPA